MGEVTPIEAGCPSGLQEVSPTEQDPLQGQMDLSHFVHKNGDISEIDLIVQGAHCGGCMAKIERGLNAVDGVQSVRMNLTTMRLHISWKGEGLNAQTLIQTLTGMGYGAAPYAQSEVQLRSENATKSLLRALAVAGFAAVNVMLLSIAIWSGGGEMSASTHTLFHWISALIAIPAIAYAGQPFFRSAFAALKAGTTNMDVPISLAVVLATTLSLYETIMGNPDTYFDASVMLLFLLLIGRYLDAKLRMKTGEAAQRLAAMQVSSATRLRADGSIETIPAIQLAVGDELLIPVGQRIPVDVTILKGRSEIDTQIATGEAVPRLYAPGDTVYSGMVNLTVPLTVRVTAKHADSFLSEITKLVEVGEQSKSRFVRIADRAARAYVPVVHTLAILTFVGWLLAGASLRPAALNAIAVLIITCPCALGLAVPAVQIVATGRLFKQGILVKSGDALERLAQITHVIFDKTGTLTEGKLQLINSADISPEALAMAAALSAHSKHPIAKAVQAAKDGASTLTAEDVRELAGEGLSGTIAGKAVRFARKSDDGSDESGNGQTTSWLSVDGQTPTAFIFSDKIRADATQTIATLEAMGLSTQLLSGDNDAATQQLAREVGIGDAQGDVSPQQKQAILNAHADAGRLSLMVGDGINDAPALAAAHASASMPNASDISRAASDIMLQGNSLATLPKAITISKQAHRRIIENLSLAVIYNFIAVPLAVFGFVNPLIAALAMSGSSLIVILNALRMARA